MSEDVFDVETQDNDKSVLETLVGEGKKFADAEALAKGKLSADEHIRKIEEENETLRKKIEEVGDNKLSFKDIVEALKETKSTEGDSEGETITEEDILKLVRKTVAGDRQAETRATNRRKGNELVLQLVEGNVEAAKQLVAERASQLGMSTKSLAELSETSPSAFATLMKGESTGSSGAPSQLNRVNTQALDKGGKPMEKDGYKTKSWFDAKRKEMGRVKYLASQEIQKELSRSIAGLGSRFND